MDEVRAAFIKEEQQFGQIPKYRVGIWRVLAQAAADKKEKQYWIDKIIAAYNDTGAEDRLHAVETLAKLRIGVVRDVPETLEGYFRLYSLWNYALESDRSRRKVKEILVKEVLNNKLTELEMPLVSYILRYIGPLSKKEYSDMRVGIEKKDFGIALRSNLLATLLISCPENLSVGEKKALKRELMALRDEVEAIPHIMMALALKGEADDREIMLDLFEAMRDTKSKNYNSDLHATAAYMLSK